ncbi:MAG TPA: transglutaminase domain-containing protein [Myxococcales bacterium]|jgi:transglutaminase-like putative cysteine protease
MSASEAGLPPRTVRYLQAVPIVAALNLHGLLHGRYLMAAPAAILLIVGIRRGWRPPWGEASVAIAAVAGAALGFAYGLLVPPPEGPVPGSLLAPICGALVPLCVVAFLSGSRTYGWTFAWLLAALSAYVRETTWPGAASLLLLVVATVVAASLAQWTSIRRGVAVLGGMAALGLVSLGGSYGIGQGLYASQGFLVGLVGGAISDLLENVADFSLPKATYVGGRGSVPDSKKALFEVTGDRPSYLRGRVMDRFDGLAWTTSPELEEATLDLRALPEPSRRSGIVLKFLANVGDRLPVPAGVREVRGASAQALGGWVVATKDSLKGRTVQIAGDVGSALPPEPRPGEAQTELPRDLRAALEPLAAPIVAGAATPRAKAEAIERFFQANFEYSLKVDLLAREHPLLVLIKEKRPAYCAYFASAMAALLRTQGIPARLVGGFALEEVNPITGATMVRERDAHAWVEAWLEDEGRFVTFDPTPADSRGQALGLERGPVGVLIDALGAWFDEQALEFRRSPSDYIADKATSKYLWAVIFLVVAWRVSLRFRGKRVERARAAMVAGDPRLVELYERYSKVLRDRAGVEAAPVDTDDALIERVRRERGEAAGAAAERFVEAYRLARYAGAEWKPEALQAALSEVERELLRRT